MTAIEIRSQTVEAIYPAFALGFTNGLCNRTYDTFRGKPPAYIRKHALAQTQTAFGCPPSG